MISSRAAALSFDPVEHVYRHHDRELPGVTTVMRLTGLLDTRWYGDDPKYRNRGKAVHEACRLIDAGEYSEEGTHPLIQTYARQYERFKQDTGFRGMCWEVAMAHIDRGFAGTLDVVGPAGDEFWLIDVKTGEPPPLVGVQLAGYEHLIQEGMMVPDPTLDTMPSNWLTRLLFENPKTKFRLKSLYLPGGDALRGVLKSHDEQKYKTIWRAAVTVLNARKEANLL